ncbi:MAG: hypothetical protein KDC53_18495 [Saprospiraceae bacterium]|nr:hypothetical protein [Saprospiraceae bacterium]
MRSTLLTILKKVFDIREGEHERALLMQLNFFLIIATLLIVKPTVTGIFLSELGASKLPLAYLLVAVVAIAVSSLYAKILGRINLNRIIHGTLYVSVFLFILFGFLLRHGAVSGWILYTFYIVVAIFAVLSVSQFWVLANVIFNVRQAKRIFGFIGAGAIGGGIVGGYITTLLAGPLGSENLIFVAAAILFICIPTTHYIWQKFVLSSQTRFQRRKKIPKLDHPLFLIRKSKHLTNLSVLIAISVVVAKLVDYQFSAITSSIITDPDELTAFLGFWFSNFNVFSLLIQLILTRKIVNKIGIGGSIFLLPASILIGAVLVLVVPSLWSAVILKSSDASLKQSLNRATFELLVVPIPPEIKNQVKIFIDVVIDSVATGAGGLILIFLVNSLNLSIEFIGGIILLLLGLWFYFGRRVRISYLQAFKKNLKNLSREEILAIDLENDSLVSDLRNILREGNDAQIISVLRQLRIQPDKRFLEPIRELLQHPHEEVQEQAIRNLYLLPHENLSKMIAPFLQSKSLSVRVAAFSYLISRSGKSAAIFIRRYLEIKDYQIYLPLLVSIAEEVRENHHLAKQLKLSDRLLWEFNELATRSAEVRKLYTIYLLKAAGYVKDPLLFSLIDRFMTHLDLEIRNTAIKSAGNTLDPYFIPGLIEMLGEKSNEKAAISALIHYGDEIIGSIMQYIGPARVSRDILKNVPEIIKHFPGQMAVDFLFTLLQENNPGVHFSVLRALVEIKGERPTLNFYRKKSKQHLLSQFRYFSMIAHSLFHLTEYAKANFSTQDYTMASSKKLNGILENEMSKCLEQSHLWLYLMSPPIKSENDSRNDFLVQDKPNYLSFSVDRLPDSAEKRSYMDMQLFLENGELKLLPLSSIDSIDKTVSFVLSLLQQTGDLTEPLHNFLSGISVDESH